MGKSIRSKSKRIFRAKKREDSVYAAVHAARLYRLHQKLKEITLTDKEDDVEEVSEFSDEKEEGMQMQTQDDQTAMENAQADDAMELDSGAGPSSGPSKRVSTHGPRESRRETWRKAKGLPPRTRSRGLNKQGIPAGRRKAGRSQRRR